MKNAIIVLNYNDSSTTVKLVDNIKNYQKLNKIIIVDNCSTDDSYEILCKNYYEKSNIDIIKTNCNKGYACGNNFGVNYAIEKYNVDYVFIANPDIFFTEDIIYEVERTFNQFSDIAILAPKVSKGYNSWVLPDYWKVLASMFLILNRVFGNKSYSSQNDIVNYVDVVAGSLFAIRADVFKSVSGFDERTFLYYEENILAYKLKQKNYKSAILGNITYDHNHATTTKKVFKSKLKLFKIGINSIKVYTDNYLKINILQRILFKFVYTIAWTERAIYDVIWRCLLFLKKDNK